MEKSKAHEAAFDKGWKAGSQHQYTYQCPYANDKGGFQSAWLRGWNAYYKAWQKEEQEELERTKPFVCLDCGTVFLHNGAIRKSGIETGNWKVLMGSFEETVTFHKQIHDQEHLRHLAGLGAAYYVGQFLRSLNK